MPLRMKATNIFPLVSCFLGFLLLAVESCFASGARNELSVAGRWGFALDREDVGIERQWFNRRLTDRISLPGALQSQGFGDEISTNTQWVLSLHDKSWFLREDYVQYTRPGDVKVPFVCQPPRHYLGAAWYQRDIEIPTNWKGRRVVLFLERPHWESRVWLDDKLVGTNDSLCVPHEFELGMVTPGKHTLTVRVDNRMLLPYRLDAHSVSDSLGQSWNGIVGAMELRTTPSVWIEDLRVFPRAQTSSVIVRGRLGNVTGRVVTNQVGLCVLDRFDARPRIPTTNVAVICSESGGSFEVEVSSLNRASQWDEFAPQLFELSAVTGSLIDGDSRKVLFGFREFKTSGTDFIINGRKGHLRGTHHGGDFPLTGYPPCDVDYWKKLFRTCKEWGLNHVRFHSFCPPEAAFAAADEIGIYLQPEPGMWNTFMPGSPMEEMLYRETERMLKAYGNHPSFVLFSPSNEPKGEWREVLSKWAEHFRERDPRRLYTTGTGFTDPDAPGPLDKVDYTATQRFGRRPVRGSSAWFGGDYSGSLGGIQVPVVSHELGQWCAYPDFDIIRKFAGYMRPGNHEIFRSSAAEHGLLKKNEELSHASGRFQLACYKEEIEANLRTPGLAGFQLLDLHDYVGQGTALVGLLDPFWEEKDYVKADEWRRFCNTTVPLARLGKRVFTTVDRIGADVEVAHFGSVPLTNSAVTWQIVDTTGKSVAGGEFAPQTLAVGRNPSLGKVSCDLSRLAAPAAYKLVVAADARKAFENDWNFWLYPATSPDASTNEVFVTGVWEEAERRLFEGGRVLFLPRSADLCWSSPPLDRVPVFWNRLMNPNWTRMLGLWCDAKHPALAKFPTESHCDWQWTEITRGVRAINLDFLPRKLQPIVQAVDDWNRNWKLGLIFECKVGKGRLMVCSFNLDSDLSDKPVARQLRRSLLDYMTTAKFRPEVEVSPTQIRTFLFDSRIMARLGATADATGSGANNVIDGDPNTFWQANGRGRETNGAEHPYEFTVRFPKAVRMDGLVLMSRQNDRNHLGDIRGYSIQASDTGRPWREVARGELASAWRPQEVRFSQPVTATQLKLTALSGFGGDRTAALAELAIIYAGPKLSSDDRGDMEFRRSRSTSTDVEEGPP